MDIANKIKLRKNNAREHYIGFLPDPSYKINVSGEKFEAMDTFYHGLSEKNKKIYGLLGDVARLYNKEMRKKIPEYKEIYKGEMTPEDVALEHMIQPQADLDNESLEDVGNRLMTAMGYTKEQKHEWLNGQYLSLLRTAQRYMK